MNHPTSLTTLISRFARILLQLCLCTSTLFAASGKITGRVIDRQTGEPLPGANVVITYVLPDGSEAPFDRRMGSSTDPDGYFFILNVPPGTYAVKASMIGYSSVIQKSARVDLDRTVTVDFELTPSEIQMEQVVIEARQEVIKPDVAGTQEVIMTSRLEQMPVTRLDEFVNRVKGVELVSSAEGNGLSVRGGAIRETDVRLDGISLQDPRSENSYLALNSTTVEEIQILTGGFQAKYGGIRSGLLNVVTKDGSRDRYTLALKVDMAPAQQKFFGTNPWSSESWIYRIFAGEYAMSGVTPGDTTVPIKFRNFRGWAYRFTQDRRLDSLQKLELWKRQHPQYDFGNRPIYTLKGASRVPFRAPTFHSSASTPDEQRSCSALSTRTPSWHFRSVLATATRTGTRN